MDCIAGVSRKPWSLPFEAEPEQVAALRRITGLHLGSWGLHGVIDAAQLCVSELASNVIDHVGIGTPATLAVSMRGPRLRIEVHDPDTRALPTLIDATPDAEAGRGMALIGAVTDRWGIQLQADRKVTWCELATGLSPADGRSEDVCVNRVEAVLSTCRREWERQRRSGSGPLSVAVAEASAVELIADVLHWLRARGGDADEALDHAQVRFEAEVSEAANLPRGGSRGDG